MKMAELATTLTYIFCAILFFYIGLCSGRTLSGKSILTPVVIVPGHGGNQVMMKIDRKEPIRPGCPTSTGGWVQGWLDLWNFLPSNLDCWIEHNKMAYNEKTGEYDAMEGVDHKVPDWGGVSAIEYLDPSITAYLLGNVGSYFAPIVKKLKSWGYEPGVNLRSAPYDFRYSPASMPNFYDPLRQLVEETYHKNDNTRVSLVGHSMGGLLIHYFLDKQTNEWKYKYVHSMVTMNTPWKGVIDMVEAMVSGYTWGIEFHANTFRTMQRSCESGVFLVPSRSEWGEDEVLVVTENKNYTVKDYDALFEDIGFPVGKPMWRQVEHALHHLDNPGVDTWCFYGSGTDTPKTLVYDAGKFPDGPPRRIMGDGDGTANLRSASMCQKWKDNFDNVVVAKEMKGITHNGILSSEVMFAELEQILM